MENTIYIKSLVEYINLQINKVNKFQQIIAPRWVRVIPKKAVSPYHFK